MMVIDLQHYLDLDDDTPAPARKLADQLGRIVKAATAGDTNQTWPSALPCPRRPGNKPCQGRLSLLRTDPNSTIHYQCSSCGDQGQISNWEHSPFDLRPTSLTLAGAVHEIALTLETADTLRELFLLDPNCERAVFRIRTHNSTAILSISDNDLDELINATAAEANHESNRRREQRLDAAFDALQHAAENL